MTHLNASSCSYLYHTFPTTTPSRRYLTCYPAVQCCWCPVPCLMQQAEGEDSQWAVRLVTGFRSNVLTPACRPVQTTHADGSESRQRVCLTVHNAQGYKYLWSQMWRLECPFLKKYMRVIHICRVHISSGSAWCGLSNALLRLLA